MKITEYFASTGSESQFIGVNLKRLNTEIDGNAVLKLWEQGGLLSVDWDSEGRGTRHWQNVVSHMTSVAVLAESLAIPMSKELPHFTVDDKPVQTIVHAALIHDFDKRLEQKAMEQARKSGTDPFSAAYDCHDQSRQIVMAVFQEKVARLYHSTGDDGIEKAMNDRLDLMPSILFYSDYCVSNTKIVGYKRRMDDLIPHFAPGGRYHGADEIYKKRYGMTHRQTHDYVILPLERKFTEIIGKTPEAIIHEINSGK